MPELATDNAMLAVIATAFLIREGGQVLFTPQEWQAAMDHEGSLFIHRDDEDRDVDVALMRPVVKS